MKKLILIAVITISFTPLYSQSVGIGDDKFTPNESAALEIQSSAKGLLIPRMTADERTAISAPAEGLLVFQIDETPGFYYYNNEEWVALNDGNNDTDTDPENEIQLLDFFDNELSLSNGNSVKFQTSEIQEFQNLRLEDDTLKISNGNYVLIPMPDDLGDHTLTQNIRTNGRYISGDGGNEGISIASDGTVTISGAINLGASAVQASELAVNSVTTAKIGDNQVTRAKLGADVPLGTTYKGTWDASTNDPNLSSGSGLNGNYYTVTVPGSINLGNGVTSFNVDDWVIYNGADWVKLRNSATTESVSSVFGRTGAIVATANDYTWAQIDKTTSSVSDVTDVIVNTPLAGQILVNNGTNWYNRAVYGDLSISGAGEATLAAGSVELTHLHNSTGGVNSIMYWNGTAWRETIITAIEGDGSQVNEVITNAALVGTELQITEAGIRHDVELSPLVAGGSDDQTLTNASLTGTTLRIDIEDGNFVTVNLSDLLGSDDQNLKNFDLSGTTLSLGIEDGDPVNVNLSSLVDDADADPDNETITSMSYNSFTNNLTINEGGAANVVNLSGFSDRRLKENIVSTKLGLSELNQIEVVDYRFISNQKPQTGIIAQDLYEVLPNLVNVGGDNVDTDPWRVDYKMLTPILIKSTQELNQKVEDLKAENAELKEKLANMEAYEQKLKDLEEKVNQLLNN